MKNELLTACDQALAAAANGTYQGLLLALVVALGLKLLGRTNAATRHSVWFITLLLLVALLPAHWWLDPRGPDAKKAQLAGPQSRSPASPPPLPAEPVSLLQPLPWAVEIASLAAAPESISSEQEFPTSAPLLWLEPPPAGVGSEAQASSGLAVPSPSAEPVRATDRVSDIPPDSPRNPLAFGSKWNPQPISWNLTSKLNLPSWAGAALVAAWLALAGIKLGWLIRRLFTLRNQKRHSLPAAPELEELFQVLRARLGVRRRVALRVSVVDSSPVVLGFVHPVVLLPAAAPWAQEAAEAAPVLRHELAHVRRRDDWANLFQRLIQAVFFFHPGVWWVSRQLTLDREIACDDCVLEQVREPRAYALLLANLAIRTRNSSLLLAPGASTSKSQLQQRINMILDTRRNTSPFLAKTRLGFITSAAALVALLAVFSGPRLILAQTATPRAAKSPPEAPGQALSDPATPAAPAGLPSAEEPEAPPAPVAVNGDTGPRFKPETPEAPALPPVAVAAPAVPAPRAPGMYPAPRTAPLVAVTPHPLALAAAPPGAPGSSIEERLDRLERMVRSLMAEQHGRRAYAFGFSAPEPKPDAPLPKNFEQYNEMVQRQAARAEQEAKRAAEEAKRAAKEFEKAMKDRGDWERDAQKSAFQQQLESLRRARESLQRQMEKLNAEIQRLEQEKGKSDQDQPRRKKIRDQSEDDAKSEATPKLPDGQIIEEDLKSEAAKK